MFLVPLVVSWLKPTPIHVGVAFYTYERAFQLEGNAKTYFYENRNLVSDCSLRRVEQALPKGRAKTPDPQSWVVSKFLLENMTDQSITKFRMSFKSPLVRPTTTLFTTPNVEATGAWEATAPDAPHLYVVSITSLPPMASAVLSLKTPIDEAVRQFVYVEHGRVTVQVPFLSADQFETFPLKISRLNSMQILNRESVLRTGDETFANEKIEVTMLRSDEPDLKEEAASYQLLPKAKQCPEGTAGDW
ncbi:MAG: hypothetical protein CAF43_005440 [Nitrospira sp. CG24C]|nr:MAG: hypothetical protein CAF43_005440 [Nitrospira sp. CG24C]TKB52249.1 MAG: hypothetical protein E8D50_10435 [Nitrospira sp.]